MEQEQWSVSDIVELYVTGILTVREMIEEMDEKTGLETRKGEKAVWDILHVAFQRWDDEIPPFFFVHLLYSDQRSGLRMLIERENLIAQEKNPYYRQVAEVCSRADRRTLKEKANVLAAEIKELVTLRDIVKDGFPLYEITGERKILMSQAWYEDEIHTKTKLLDILDSFS